ncbi:hypothetical protein GCM10009085_54820 [Pseudomonas avellanae]|nr:hypothetical protein GCM10009085_54820 [Pseudomonas avellanae]
MQDTGKLFRKQYTSYAIVGTLEDLYRLFSYQQFLYAEVEYYLTDEWAAWRKRQFNYIQGGFRG